MIGEAILLIGMLSLGAGIGWVLVGRALTRSRKKREAERRKNFLVPRMTITVPMTRASDEPLHPPMVELYRQPDRGEPPVRHFHDDEVGKKLWDYLLAQGKDGAS